MVATKCVYFHLFWVSCPFTLFCSGVRIPHLHHAHGLFTSHSSPSSLMLLFVELNIENLFCLSTAFIFHAIAWLGVSQWNCAYSLPVCLPSKQPRCPSLCSDASVGEYKCDSRCFGNEHIPEWIVNYGVVLFVFAGIVIEVCSQQIRIFSNTLFLAYCILSVCLYVRLCVWNYLLLVKSTSLIVNDEFEHL